MFFAICHLIITQGWGEEGLLQLAILSQGLLLLVEGNGDNPVPQFLGLTQLEPAKHKKVKQKSSIPHVFAQSGSGSEG